MNREVKKQKEARNYFLQNLKTILSFEHDVESVFDDNNYSNDKIIIFYFTKIKKIHIVYYLNPVKYIALNIYINNKKDQKLAYNILRKHKISIKLINDELSKLILQSI